MKKISFTVILALGICGLGVWQHTDRQSHTLDLFQNSSDALSPSKAASSYQDSTQGVRESPQPPTKALSSENTEAKARAEISALISRIGTRDKPRPAPPNAAELIKQRKDDMRRPLRDVFPVAQELVDRGTAVVIPLSEYWASLHDPSSDNFIAATRALRALQSREETHRLFLRLAANAEDGERKEIFLKAAKRFEPISVESRDN